MTFDDLYGLSLTRELASADVTKLFTTARRKAAINAGQLEFVDRTECLTRQTSVSLSDETQEYDLEGTTHTSGTITCAVDATAKTFTRSTGSFLDDGFTAGDSITITGCTNSGNNSDRVIASVTALVITVTSSTSLVTEAGTGDELIISTGRDFFRISAQGVSIQITDDDDHVRYLEGDDLIVTTVARLNQEQPGWRAWSPATPQYVYPRRHNGSVYLGFAPAPSISSTDTWVAIVPYVLLPVDLSADTDSLFTVGGNVVTSLRLYERAVVHFAAHDLEKLRKDADRAALQFQLFESYVARYKGNEVPKSGTRVRFAKDYRGQAMRGGASRRMDPRT